MAVAARLAPARVGRSSEADVAMVLLSALPSLGLPVVVMAGILSGVFTATEASAVAVLYALGLAWLHGEARLSDLPPVFVGAARTTGVVLFLVGTSVAFSWVLAYAQAPQAVTAALLELSGNPVVLLLLMNLTLLVVGTFLDMTPAVLIFTPIFLSLIHI